MRLLPYPDKQALGAAAAERIADGLAAAVAARGKARLVLASAASQFETLDALVARRDIDWPRVELFHLDEYVGMAPTHPASFVRFQRERVLARLPAQPAVFHALRGDAPDPAAECARVGALLAGAPPDVACIGIGENGHIAFNDPPADFDTDDAFVLVDLDDACRRQQLGEGWFPTLDLVPRRAITMSVRQILRARRIVCPVPDARKAEAVRTAVEGPVDNRVAASALRFHDDCDIFLDGPSAKLLSGMWRVTPAGSGLR